MRKTTRQDYEERLLRVLVHIQQHLDDKPSLEDLAAVAHFSPFHFHRVFRGMTGESVQAYQRRLKLERAAGRLIQTDDSVLQIALEAGFESHAAFTRAFKAQRGLAPSAWREASRVDFSQTTDPRALLAQSRGEIEMEVKIVEEKDLQVAFVRHTGPYNQCGQAWEKLCSRLGADGLLGRGPRFIGLSYDDPEVTPADKVRYDACVEVGEGFEPSGEIGIQVLPGGTFARVTHFGPYANLNRTYAELLGRWIPSSGYLYLNQPTREIYMNDPENTEPKDLVTDIYLPVEESG